MRKPSPATAVALLALFVALGGTATAARSLITSRDIKDGTIRIVDLAPATKQALRGRVGRQGPIGPPGPAGATGPAGGFNPTKIGYYAGSEVVVPAGEVGLATASCPAGTKAIAGGFNASVSSVAASAMRADGSLWFVVVFNDTPIEVKIQAVAVCAAP